MNTFLIISSNKIKREAWIKQFSQERSIDVLDIITLETDGSIGIEHIRDFQKQLLLKPLKSHEKATVIAHAHLLTTAAQNALLKTLEEPPDNTYVILSAETDANFLPTILSRTSRINLQEAKQFTKSELQETTEVLTRLQEYSLGEKLKLAEALSADKQKALSWIEKAIYITREKLLGNTTSQDIIYIENLQQTYTLLKTTNINLRFALENLFLYF